MFSSVRVASAPADVEAYRAAPYFGVSITKLVVMSIFTGGFYEIYWCYRHWKAEREREKEDMMPFFRAVFAPLWAFSLFGRIQGMCAKHVIPATWSATGLALIYLTLSVASRLPDPLWLVSFLNFIPLIIVQRSVNALNAAIAPEAPQNDHFTGANVVLLLIGGVLVLLVILGIFMPEATQKEMLLK